MQEATAIRSAATEEIAGFLRRLDDERGPLLETAAKRRRASSPTRVRLRDRRGTPARRHRTGARAQGSQVLDAANRGEPPDHRAGDDRGEGHARRSRSGRRAAAIVRDRTAPADARAREGDVDSGHRRRRRSRRRSEPRRARCPPPRRRRPRRTIRDVRWRAEGNRSTATTARPPASPSPPTACTPTAPRGTQRRVRRTACRRAPPLRQAATDAPSAPRHLSGDIVTVEAPKKRRWGIFGRAS